MNIDLQARQIQPVRQTYSRVAAYTGGRKPASRYLEATLDIQPTHNFHYRPTWDPEFDLFDTARSAIKMADWNALRDPRQYYYATWTMARSRQQEAMEANYQFVASRGLIERMPDVVRTAACAVLMPLRHVAWAGNMNNSQICAIGYGAMLTAPALMHGLDHLATAQYLTRLGLSLGATEALDAGKQAWLSGADWQPLRRLVENMLVEKDPMRLMLAQNMVLDGVLYPLIYSVFVDDHLAAHGGGAVGMMCAFMTEWHLESAAWIDAVQKVCATESDANRQLLSDWYCSAVQATEEALTPVARLALGGSGASALAGAREILDARAAKAGLSI